MGRPVLEHDAAALFERLFAEGRDALLAGTHRVESVPADGLPRWGVGVVLRPDAAAARTVEEEARKAASLIGSECWLAGARHSSHLSLRRGLEPFRTTVSVGDRQVARYAAALRKAVCGVQPLRFAVTGLTLTPVSVMACAAPADSAAGDLAAAFGAALSGDGQAAPGITPSVWYLNLAYFTGPVRRPESLIDWVAARRATWVTDVMVTKAEIVRWQHTSTGMDPVPLSSVTLPPG